MLKDNSHSGTRILFTVLAGAAAGSIVTLLTTPRAGAHFRALAAHRIRDAGKQLACLPATIRDAYETAAERTARAMHWD